MLPKFTFDFVKPTRDKIDDMGINLRVVGNLDWISTPYLYMGVP